MSFSERLRNLRIHLFGERGQKHFAQYIGIPQSSLGKYEKSVSPNVQSLERIILRTGCSPRWLVIGEGDMFESSTTSVRFNEKPDVKSIRYYGINHSLGFKWPPKEIPLTIPIPKDFVGDYFFSLNITGDVLNPEINEGDFCIFEKIHIQVSEVEYKPMTPKNLDTLFKLKYFPFNQRIVLIAYDGFAEIRRLFVDVYRKLLVLMPINNHYFATSFYFIDKGKFTRGNEKFDSVEVVGTLVSVVRRYNIFSNKNKKKQN